MSEKRYTVDEYGSLGGCIIAERDDLLVTVAALTARVAELEKDAARYRWLRERAIGVEMYPDVQGLVFAIPLPAEMSLNIVPAFVDSCIDAALSGADGGSQS